MHRIQTKVLHWQHVAGDQWQLYITGTAEGLGKFRYPINGVYVVVGIRQAASCIAFWTNNANLMNIFCLSDWEQYFRREDYSGQRFFHQHNANIRRAEQEANRKRQRYEASI